MVHKTQTHAWWWSASQPPLHTCNKKEQREREREMLRDRKRTERTERWESTQQNKKQKRKKKKLNCLTARYGCHLNCRWVQMQLSVISADFTAVWWLSLQYILVTDRKNSTQWNTKITSKVDLYFPPWTPETTGNPKNKPKQKTWDTQSIRCGKRNGSGKGGFRKGGIGLSSGWSLGGLLSWILPYWNHVGATGTAAGRAEDWSVTDGHGGVSGPTEKRDVQLNLSSRWRWDPARTAWWWSASQPPLQPWGGCPKYCSSVQTLCYTCNKNNKVTVQTLCYTCNKNNKVA